MVAALTPDDLAMSNTPDLVVFSDLDGTLLDHRTYDWSAARPALDRLNASGCPVVLCSSKTSSEIAAFQQAMGLSGLPAIVENGAGVIGLAGEASSDTASYAHIRHQLDALPFTLRAQFLGFGDITASDLCHLTGLTEDAARLAQHRDFSEPGVWSGSDQDQIAFEAALRAVGLTAQQGGRFLTVSGGRTKADGMAQVLAHYRPRLTLALGDAPNDIDMLQAADFGVIVANPHRSDLPRLAGETAGRITRTRLAGPEGWNAAVTDFLNTHLPTGPQSHG